MCIAPKTMGGSVKVLRPSHGLDDQPLISWRRVLFFVGDVGSGTGHSVCV